MKNSMTILFVLVVASLVLSLFSFLILVENHIGINLGSSGPSSTAPVATPIPSAMSVSYIEIGRETKENNTQVALLVNATYTGGKSISVPYSEFYLQLYAPRMGTFLPQGIINPLNNGSLAIRASQPNQIFQLQFVFPTTTFNGMDYNVRTFYSLEFSGVPSVTWVNQSIR